MGAEARPRVQQGRDVDHRVARQVAEPLRLARCQRISRGWNSVPDRKTFHSDRARGRLGEYEQQLRDENPYGSCGPFHEDVREDPSPTKGQARRLESRQ
jgi:hypothetical protein